MKKKIIIIGSPNVGKSLIFNYLTGNYSTVSNYPGTSVEIFRGEMRINGVNFEIIDTPGMYSLMPVTEEEDIARSILLEEKADCIVQVADAKNLERMLTFTLQLIEAEMPVILVINMIDEARRLGITVDVNRLQEELGIPVVATIATEYNNLDLLKKMIAEYKGISRKAVDVKYSDAIEIALSKIVNELKGEYLLSKRAIGLLLLSEDACLRPLVLKKEKENYKILEAEVNRLKKMYRAPLNYLIMVERFSRAARIHSICVLTKKASQKRLSESLSRLMMNPWSGAPIFLVIIFLFYEFVGVFGAQVLVEFIEDTIFSQRINPAVQSWIKAVIPWTIIQDLIVNDYGIITLGVRYAISIVLPIVATFFIAFSIIEDTGYLPRLAMLIDRIFKAFGLNGRAVIPIVLGFGCNTMATLVTRTLETKRERIIASFMLALAIPCSAQLGIIFALLGGSIKALAIWMTTMATVFVVVGWMTARILPGEKPLFYMEVPPLRFPKLSNIFVKTYTRVGWYLKEVFPLFILASVFIWLGRLTGIFDLLIRILEYPVQWIGLPKESAVAFLFGFFRRDYGAAGLYDLKARGIISGIPLVVAAVTMTIFVPCVAQFAITVKERGIKTAVIMAAFIFPFAFLMGWVISLLLTFLKISI